MSVYTPTATDFRETAQETETAKRSPAKGGPVLMADCTTPLAGETLLSLFWKRWDRMD